MKAFPKPLTAEEEKDCLVRYKGGDEKARQILIEYNLRLVAHIVKKYQSSEDDMEELISIGTIGLIKAYYEPIGTDKEGNEIQLLDIIESREPPAFDQIGLKDDTRKVYGLLEDVLSERERQVIIMRYGLYRGREYTQREIAQKLGISRSYISRIEKNALNRLKEYFRD